MKGKQEQLKVGHKGGQLMTPTSSAVWLASPLPVLAPVQRVPLPRLCK